MRVVYRGLIGLATVLAVTVAAVVFLVMDRGRDAHPTARPAQAGSSARPAVSHTGPGVAVSAAASALTPSPSPTVPIPASPTAGPSRGRSVLAMALADPRVPKLPKNRKLANFPGRGAPTKGRVVDKRSGLTFPRFVKAWRPAKPSPFTTRRLLPSAKGMPRRGLLATCPVPVAVQKKLKDTAFLAARWTLTYHPAGSTITWTASQPIKAGKRKGWLLGYRVHYRVHHKRHISMAAVAVVDVSSARPVLVFMSVPDAQKKRWADINSVMSGLRAK